MQGLSVFFGPLQDDLLLMESEWDSQLDQATQWKRL